MPQLKTVQEFVSETKPRNYMEAQVWFAGRYFVNVKIFGYDSGQPDSIEVNLTGDGSEISSRRHAYHLEEERNNLKRAVDIAKDLQSQGYKVHICGTPSIKKDNFCSSIEKAEELLREYDKLDERHSPQDASSEDPKKIAYEPEKELILAEETDKIVYEIERSIPPLHVIKPDETSIQSSLQNPDAENPDEIKPYTEQGVSPLYLINPNETTTEPDENFSKRWK